MRLTHYSHIQRLYHDNAQSLIYVGPPAGVSKVGTMLAEAGKSGVVIKEAARHADISTSMRYVHMANEKLKDEVEDALWRAVTFCSEDIRMR